MVFLAGLALRLLHLGSKSLWIDEAYAAGLMDMDPIQLVRMSVAGSPHPPLSFLFLRFSAMLFGHGETGLRMVPALASALAAVPLMLFAARRIGRKAALWTGIVWAVSPYSVSLGQEAWIYGILSLLGFGLIELADRAWRGSRTSLRLTVAVALAGVLVQHLFLLFTVAALALYFTLPRNERIPWKKVVAACAVFIVLYSPFALLMLDQASFRSERIARAALDMSEVYRYRLLSRIPTVFARLIPGGLLAEASGSMMSDAKQLAFWGFFTLVNFFLLAVLFTRRMLSIRFRLWLAGLFFLPLLLFIVEDPTVRHLTIMWVPLGTAIAAAVDRWRPLGPVLVVSTAVMLLPYYNISSFPYHRSDWKEAVALVEERIMPEEGIVVIGGNAGGLAWDYYASAGLHRLAPGGDDPYSEHIEPGRSLRSALDSMLAVYPSIWIVNDMWGPSAVELLEGSDDLDLIRVSPAMEVIRVSR